ncbi:hypothetical protein AX14_003040 [Amanita brunnescens Koide BX004]|nr:hypothetical protein AX14_003040 [Amanita brunnescens Koide BX004]
MASLSSPWSHPDLQSSTLFVGLTIGNVIGFCLYGALTVQIYMYHIAFPNDSKLLKTNVYIIYLAETVYTIILAYDLTQIVIKPHYIACLPSLVVPIFGGIVAIMTQAVYAHRIWIITESKLLSIGFTMLIIAEVIVSFTLLGVGITFYIATFVSFFHMSEYYELMSVFQIWAVTCLFADATIAGIMVWNLTKEKIYSRQLRQRITRLLHIIVGSGILTVGVNVITLVGASITSSSITFCSGIVLSKIYANSMMVLVNSRIPSLSQNGTPSCEVATLQIGTLQFGEPSTGTTAEEQHEQEKDTFVRGEAHKAEA